MQYGDIHQYARNALYNLINKLHNSSHILPEAADAKDIVS